MRTILFTIFIVFGSGFLFYWNKSNQDEMARKEAELLEDIDNEDLKRSIERVVKHQANPSAPIRETVPPPSEIIGFQVKDYEWKLAPGMPGTPAMKTATVELLNLLRSMDDQDKVMGLAKRKEMLKALLEYNKNPDQAKEMFEYLLGQSEIQQSDGVMANLLKVSGYASFNKETMVELAEQVMTTETINPSATKVEEINSKHQLTKIREASKIIIDQKANNKDEAVEYVRNSLSQPQHPLVKEELLTQLGIHFPEEAKALRAKDQEDGNETLKDYFLKEANQ